MPLNNNNQKVPSAVGRVSELPVVRSACSTLLVLYRDGKRSNPGVKSLCEALESGVTAAFSRVSPVIVKLEPQISIANNVACKGLDWLETSFPVLLSPTQEVVSAARTKINELQEVVSVAASGTIDCVQHTVTWVMSRVPQADGANQSVVEKAISVVSVGLDSALTLSEALMDHVLPPVGEDTEKEAHLEGFAVAARSGSYPVRMVKLTGRLCRRTCHAVGSKIPSVQVRERFSRSTLLVQDLQTSCWTLVWTLQGLPQYLQHQAVSVWFFIIQMYNLKCPTPQPDRSRSRSRLIAADASHPNKEQVPPHNTPTFRLRPTRTSPLENGCAKGNAH